MLRFCALVFLVNLAAACFSDDNVARLPRPHYDPQESDPAWLKDAVQLHGHLGPMVTFGARMGMAALRAVGAKGYFNVEIVCEGPFAKPPASCFLDGLQIGSALRWASGTWSGSTERRSWFASRTPKPARRQRFGRRRRFWHCWLRRPRFKASPPMKSTSKPRTPIRSKAWRGRSPRCPSGKSSPSGIPIETAARRATSRDSRPVGSCSSWVASPIMKLIQILGAGCRKCETLKKNAKTAVAELGIEATVEAVSDINKIVSFNVLTTPALVVDGEVKVVGKVPTVEEIKELLA